MSADARRPRLRGTACAEQPAWSDDDDLAPPPRKKIKVDAAGAVMPRLLLASARTVATEATKLADAGWRVAVIALDQDTASSTPHAGAVWRPCAVDRTNTETAPLNVREDEHTGAWARSGDELYGVAFLIERLCTSFGDDSHFAAVVASAHAGDAARLVVAAAAAALRKESVQGAAAVVGAVQPPACARMRELVRRYRNNSKRVVRAGVREYV